MEDRIRLSYFYGKEADQFSFYKIPKLLFTEEYFKKISVEAKVLYGLMLDMMSLSMKNQWMDDEGRAYIYYSLEDIMEALGCSNKKAISIMKELDTDADIGLIEKKRQGQGKPTMIYLKQLMVLGALNNVASRYFLMLCTFVVFDFIHPIAYSICELVSFRNLLLTSSAGYLLDATTISLFLHNTVSKIRSKMPLSNSLSNGYLSNRISRSILSLISSAYACTLDHISSFPDTIR